MSAPGTAPSPAQVRRIVIGLLPANFLGAIDGSILPVALLTIGQALGDVSLIAWVMAGYLVAGTVATPIYGKLSDLHGRRRILLVALSIATCGSVLCALSVSMPMLIGARVLQGLGSGALFALAQAAAADVVSGAERGRYQGYFSSVFATSALAAPLIGGYLTEHLSWRAVFWMNLPLAAFAAWRVRAVLVAPAPHADRRAPIDWSGAVLLAAGLGVPLVALARIGHGAAWLGASTLGLVAVGVLLLALWAWRESDAIEPIVPMALFRSRVVVAACVANGLNFFVLIGSTVLLPLSMQVLAGARTDQVALRIVALTLATPTGAFVGGQLMLRWPRIDRIAAAGSALAAVGLAMLSASTAPGALAPLAAMAPLGFGLGLTLPAVMVAAQGAVPPASIGVVTSLVAFFRSLGGVIGIAVLTSVVMASAAGGALASGEPAAVAHAFGIAFGLSAAVAAASALVSLRIGPVSRAAGGASGAARS